MEMEYIKNSLVDLRRLLDSLIRTKETLQNNKGLTRFDFHSKDFKNFKLLLLAVLFTENYDDIIDNLDEALKEKIITNQKISRTNSDFSFENGGYFKIGSGIKINKIPDGIDSDNYYMILRMIRNGIAHSHFTYENGIVKIQAYRGTFEAECDVDWLEMMVLCLFANTHSTTKKGVKDIQIELFADSSLDLDYSDIFVVKLENGNDSDKRMDEKLTVKKLVFKEMAKEELVKRDNEIELIKKIYNLCNLKVTDIKRISSVREKLLAYSKINYNSLPFERKSNLLKSKFLYLYDEEKRNTIAYKHVLDLLNIANGSQSKQTSRLRKSGTEFMVDCMGEFAFKTYINFVYNYMLEKIDFDMSDLELEGINVKTKIGTKSLERHIRNACCHNRIKINEDNVYMYDMDKNGVVNFEVEVKMDDFIQLTDKLIKNLLEKGIIEINDENIFKVR